MFRFVRGCAGVLLAGVIVAAVGCNPNKPPSDQNKSLYDRLGGQPAIAAVVDKFVDRAAQDPRVNFTRKGHPNDKWQPTQENVAKLKASVTRFIVQATGGPQEYNGPSMVDVHKGMEISNEEFDAFADDLKKTLDEFKVPEKEQSDLLNAVGGLRDQIVGK